jgi:hypothetical protein
MMKKIIRPIIRKFGWDVVKYRKFWPSDFEKRHLEIIDKVRPYTITSNDRLYALIESVRYILLNDIKGAMLECGVFMGGSMMTIALTLMTEGVTDRELYLFDTFEGMPAPGEKDIDHKGIPAFEEFSQKKISDVSSTWVNASLESVKQAMLLTGYPSEKIHFIKGLVEETIPEKAPETIALLRLDTDWYQSTIHELTHLYPRLSPKGILIVDDYGHFKGAREAVDEYFHKNKMVPFLHRIDYTGRLIIKMDD